MLENTPLEKGKKNLPMLFGGKVSKGEEKKEENFEENRKYKGKINVEYGFRQKGHVRSQNKTCREREKIINFQK